MRDFTYKAVRKHGAHGRFQRSGCRVITTLTFASETRSYTWLTQRDAALPRR